MRRWPDGELLRRGAFLDLAGRRLLVPDDWRVPVGRVRRSDVLGRRFDSACRGALLLDSALRGSFFFDRAVLEGALVGCVFLEGAVLGRARLEGALEVTRLEAPGARLVAEADRRLADRRAAVVEPRAPLDRFRLPASDLTRPRGRPETTPRRLAGVPIRPPEALEAGLRSVRRGRPARGRRVGGETLRRLAVGFLTRVDVCLLSSRLLLPR